MGLSGDPESAKNILMEPKMIHTYVHTYITFMSEVVHMYVQYACFKPYEYFSAGQAHEVLRSRMENMAIFQDSIFSLVTQKSLWSEKPSSITFAAKSRNTIWNTTITVTTEKAGGYGAFWESGAC